MDYLSFIREPIDVELASFIQLFESSLTHSDGLLSQALEHIRKRGGKRMRPMLILLMAKNFGRVSEVTQNAAVGLELLHTASLIHDDVVDESSQRRGQPSVNATYNNKVAVLVGDYVLSTALLYVAYTKNDEIVKNLAELGRSLSNGEILQLTNIQDTEISEEVYYKVIGQKTASLFESCGVVGAISAGADAEKIEAARKFGWLIGLIFQIRDDIFDYYDSKAIGKPTGNDMLEGKLTLPIIYALKNHPDERMSLLARKVKNGTVLPEEITELVDYAKKQGGIEYAEQRMEQFADDACQFIEQYVADDALKKAFNAYLEFVIQRNN